jgi:hypothetical protein
MVFGLLQAQGFEPPVPISRDTAFPVPRQSAQPQLVGVIKYLVL